jgi:hypothetical protein
MLPFTLALARSSGTIADLLPPFQAESDGKIGLWELGGSARRNDDWILLVPPIQFTRGAAWTSAQFPTEDFSLEYTLRVLEGTSGGSAAFWFVDRYGADGDLAGGPRFFQGLALVMTVRRTARGAQTSLCWTIIQHVAPTAVCPDALESADFVLPFVRGVQLKVTIGFAKPARLAVTVDSNGEKFTKVYQDELTADLRDSYIGVTAQNDAFTGRVDLLGVTFALAGDMKQRAGVGFGEDRPKSNYVPETQAVLRNPAFNRTIVLADPNTKKELMMASYVLDVVDELIHASNGVASFKELNDWVTQTMVPYTQKWHRRTVKIIDQMRAARDVIGTAWNYSQTMVAALNGTVLANTRRAAGKLEDLGGLLTAGARNASEESGRRLDRAGLPVWTRMFVVVASLEIGAMLIFLALISNRQLRLAIFRIQ